MSSRYIFLSDIDGTLMRRDAPLTDEVVAAAREFTAKGGLLAVCTGRSVVAAQAVAEKLGVNLPCILYGGASLYDFEKKEHLFLNAFRGDIRSGIAKVLENHTDISMQVFTREEIYVLRRNDRLNSRGVKEENVGEERSLADVTGDIVKLVMCCDDAEELGSCRAYFPDSFCEFAFASRNFVDVVAKGCSKVDTMQELSRRFDIPFDHFFSAGDAMTDMPMLKLSGVSFAPANALDAVKAAVTHIVPDVKEGGMAEAFRIAAGYLDKE